MADDGFQAWIIMLGEELARLLVGFLGILGLNMLLLTATHAAWDLYSGTGTGEKFQELSSEISGHLAYVVSLPKFDFSLDISLLVLVVILPAALLLQFLHLRHYLYAAMPFFIKIAWILLATYFLANLLQAELGIPEWGVAYATALPSTMCFIPLCFTVAEHIMPDLLTCIVRTKEWFEDRF